MRAQAKLLLMGADGTQRLYLVRYAYALSMYLLCAVVQFTSVFLGLTSASVTIVLFSFVLAGQTLIFLTLRSGLNQRFRDASLTLPQMAFANVTIGFAYVLMPSSRSMMAILMALVLLFGAFTLSPRYCRLLGLWCVATLIAAMLLVSFTSPHPFTPTIEFFHGLLSSAVLLVISRLTSQLCALRIKQKLHKHALREALNKVHLIATRDELTGLANRRSALETLVQEERKFSRTAAPLCIALIDIDHFKRVNDTLGHHAGDETLRRFAAIVSSALRPGDVLARWGGEEFLLLLPNTPLTQASQVLDRLRESCDAPASWLELPHLKVSFSAGIASLLPLESTQAAMARADAALYVAKAAGRNRTALA